MNQICLSDPSETQADRNNKCRIICQILDRIGDKWTVLVVAALSEGPMRFNAIMRVIDGVSHRMLTRTLRGLEQDGLVQRTVYPTNPPKVEYQLTDLGLSLIEPLNTLFRWARHNRHAIEASRNNQAMPNPGD